WLVAAKPVNDALREKQRDALVAYILAQPDIVAAEPTIKDANGLFEYFLIDVEMGACMMTSRIKQAISSVQLFIQRCVLNMEPEVPAAHIDSKQWAWMKSNVLWEANRKVFLYPESYLLPPFRDDRTPFFKDLENQLLQNEITPINV